MGSWSSKRTIYHESRRTGFNLSCPFGPNQFSKIPKIRIPAHSFNLMWKWWFFCDFRKSLHTLLSIWILKFSNFSPHWFQKLKSCTSLQERLIHIIWMHFMINHDQRALVHNELHMLCLLQNTWVVLERTLSAAPKAA